MTACLAVPLLCSHLPQFLKIHLHPVIEYTFIPRFSIDIKTQHIPNVSDCFDLSIFTYQGQFIFWYLPFHFAQVSVDEQCEPLGAGSYPSSGFGNGSYRLFFRDPVFSSDLLMGTEIMCAYRLLSTAKHQQIPSQHSPLLKFPLFFFSLLRISPEGEIR